MQPYPKLIEQTLQSLQDFCKIISRYRDEDITDRNNFNSVFIRGRKVAKIPTSSMDVVAATDKIGDFNVTNSFAYYLILNGGSPEWRRSAVSSW